MENFSFTLTSGTGASYLVNVAEDLNSGVLSVQLRKATNEAWATTSLVQVVANSANVLNISVTDTNSNSNTAPAYYRVLVGAKVVVAGRILLVAPRAGQGEIWSKNVKKVIADALIAGNNTTISVDDTTGNISIDAVGGDSGGTVDAETVRDIVGNMLVAGSNMSVVHDDLNNRVTISATVTEGPQGPQGLRGLSAYDVAVAAGFVGTQSQWLASLKGPTGNTGPAGPKGDTGPSTYQSAVTNGLFIGTEEEFIESLKGAVGPEGPAGLGIIPGGSTGQVLAKASESDYDLIWTAQTGGSGGGVTDHGALTGLSDNDHPQYALVAHNHDDRYFTETESDGRFVRTVNNTAPDVNGNVSVASSGGTSDHGALTGLSDDDHPHYLNQSRGDARYVLGTDTRLTDARTPTAHTHTASQISDSTTTGRSIISATDAANARTIIGAGTSNLALGTTATTAKAGDYVPTWTEITSKPTTFTPSAHNHDDRYFTETESDARFVRTVNGTGPDASGNVTVTSSGGVTDHGALTGLADDDHPHYLNQTRGDARYVLGTDTRLSDARTPTAHTHMPADITDSTAVGRGLMTAASPTVARDTIGAGTSNLVIGTTSTTAKAGNYVPTWTEITSKPATFPPDVHDHDSRYYTTAETNDLLIQRSQMSITEALINHDGTAGGGSRPAGYFRVRWIGGTTRPTNMAVGDIWEHDA